MTVPQRLELKICGTTSAEDARLLNGTGVDYCGILVDVGFSPRSVSLKEAKKIAKATSCKVVILLCNPSSELCQQVSTILKPFALQLQCDESPELVATLCQQTSAEIWKTIHLPWLETQARPQDYLEAGANRLLFDAQVTQNGQIRFGGTGVNADWDLVEEQIADLAGVPCYLAGGIRPGNLREAVEKTAPFGVDLCSGVENHVGVRDPDLLDQLLIQWRALGRT